MSDLLTLANALDDAWHGQSRAFEREAVTRFWGLLTLPARAIDPVSPRGLMRAATVLRNVRFEGRDVKKMFFEDKAFTEVDAVFLNVGSSLGHSVGTDAWVVEVERKMGHNQGDYFLALRRAQRFCEVLQSRFGVHARPVVVYEDDGGRLSYDTFDQDVLLITMSALRDATSGLVFAHVDDIPGAASDRTLVKMGLLRRLVDADPNLPVGFREPLDVARAAKRAGWPSRLPIRGHQNVDRLPSSTAAWLAEGAPSDDDHARRIAKYMGELVADGLLSAMPPRARLTYEGGDVVLRTMRATEQDLR